MREGENACVNCLPYRQCTARRLGVAVQISLRMHSLKRTGVASRADNGAKTDVASARLPCLERDTSFSSLDERLSRAGRSRSDLPVVRGARVLLGGTSMSLGSMKKEAVHCEGVLQPGLSLEALHQPIEFHVPLSLR
jgi:hypothetical protein